MANPFPVLEGMRRQGPLVRAKVPIIGNVWLTTTQAAASQVLKSSEQFSVRKKDGQVVGMQWWMPRNIRQLANNMLAMDEPDHTRLRKLVDDAFHRREIKAMDNRVRQISDELFRDSFSLSGVVELVATYSRPFPLAVICELLGIPEEDRQQFTEWASGITRVSGILSMLSAFRRLKPINRYLENRIRICRTEIARLEDEPDLIRELVVAVDRDGTMSEDELVAMIFLLLFAGHETTTHFISGGVLTLLQNREELEKLRNNWSLLGLAVEEILRFVSPVQVTKPRYVQADCTVEGVRLSAGDIVMPMIVAANFDPAVFEEPEKFKIDRKPNHHMSFGTGIHFCLGHQLARLEIMAALRTIFGQSREVELACMEIELSWRKRFGLRALETLPVKAIPPR